MRLLLVCFAAVAVGGCVLAPEGAQQTRDAARQAGAAYTSDISHRTLPALSERPDWRDVLHRALLANGELEASYFEWAMAVSRIDQAGSYPSQPIELGFSYMFSGERMKSFNRGTLSAQFMDATAWPTKTYQSAKVAWRDAQAAEARFVAAKFKLQQDVLTRWADLVLATEQVRVQSQNVNLLKLVLETASGRVRAGGSQQDLLRADVQLRLAEDRLATLQSEVRQQQAMLNGLLAREPDAALIADADHQTTRLVPDDDTILLSMGVSANPSLAALAHDITGRSDALARAQMEYLPDFNPMAAVTGNVSQMIGASLVLPTELPRIRAMIEEARADLRRARAMHAQSRNNAVAEYVAAIVALRNTERQVRLFRETIGPLAQRTVDLSRQGYSAGAASYLDLVDAQRTFLEVQLSLAEARAERERLLARIESLAGVDIETVMPATAPSGALEKP
ncbi:MAG: TolC family protein [Burkholderiales bacterium]|nr:TolC family protein [Phycisphaerae bacterium]